MSSFAPYRRRQNSRPAPIARQARDITPWLGADSTRSALLNAILVAASNGNDFASSLSAGLNRFGNLTERQEAAARKSFLDPKPTRKDREKIDLGNFAPMVELFDKGSSRLKNPQIILLVPGEGEIVLSRAGSGSCAPGTINVATPGGYGNNTWYGRILRDGKFEISPRNQPSTSLVALLTAFAAEPAKVAAEFGHKTGRCCFCNKGLTDGRSVTVGYGPVCAKNYDLPWGK